MGAVKRFFLRLLIAILAVAVVGGLVILVVSNTVKNNTKDDILYKFSGTTEINQVCRQQLKDFGADCILVLGAGIKDDETPSDMLKDRLDAGIELYREGIAPKILLSGDNGQEGHNEIHVMLNYVKKAGIPESDIFCDHAGFSTYDSMYRASSIFKAQSVMVVTQEYHLYRALYIGKKLGLTVTGVASDQQSYFGGTFREGREILARFKDFFKSLMRSNPVLGGDTIPISGNGIVSHGE